MNFDVDRRKKMAESNEAIYYPKFEPLAHETTEDNMPDVVVDWTSEEEENGSSELG